MFLIEILKGAARCHSMKAPVALYTRRKGDLFKTALWGGWRQRCLLFSIWFLHSSDGFYLKRSGMRKGCVRQQITSRALTRSCLFVPHATIGGSLLLDCSRSSCCGPPHVSPAHFPLSPSSELRFYCQHHLLTQLLHAKSSLISTIYCLFYSIRYTKATPAA